jgi:hypothetical protein
MPPSVKASHSNVAAATPSFRACRARHLTSLEAARPRALVPPWRPSIPRPQERPRRADGPDHGRTPARQRPCVPHPARGSRARPSRLRSCRSLPHDGPVQAFVTQGSGPEVECLAHETGGACADPVSFREVAEAPDGPCELTARAGRHDDPGLAGFNDIADPTPVGDHDWASESHCFHDDLQEDSVERRRATASAAAMRSITSVRHPRRRTRPRVPARQSRPSRLHSLPPQAGGAREP